ncbi:universal stress protein [Streptomyces sp. NPDC048644]|uniref:universal stress protein n=1 Tax=Streptomyces sp. NPDC048644 TaxID=3365582 RepID=UPI00371CD0CF
MERPWVVGVDGSDTAVRSLDWAADGAARHGATLRIVHASLWERYEGGAQDRGPLRPTEQVLADDIVRSAAERARRRHPHLAVATEVLAADPVTALLGEGHHASVLVLGRRGRGKMAGVLLGSVTLAVAGRAPCPVVVVRGEPAGIAGAHARVLLGMEKAAESPDAARFAVREAAARGCALEAVHAWQHPAHEPGGPSPHREARSRHEQDAWRLLDGLRDEVAGEQPEVPVHRLAVEGPAHKVLMHRSTTADVLVIGGHPRAHGGPHLGRVARTALFHAACPVAIVPQRG